MFLTEKAAIVWENPAFPLPRLKLMYLSMFEHIGRSRVINKDDILDSIFVGEDGRLYLVGEYGGAGSGLRLSRINRTRLYGFIIIRGR